MIQSDFKGIKALQRQLSELIGVSGHEKPVVDFIQSQIEDNVEKMWIDPLGSLLAIIEGEGGKDRIMLDGHVDEIGFMVNYIDSKGFLRFVPIGGWDSRIFLGQSVKILAKDNKEFHGIIGSNPPHLTTQSERKTIVKISDMYIDIGLSTKEAVKSSGIQIGSVGTLYDPFVEFPNNMVRGKAFDDRTAVNVLIHLIKEFSAKPPLDTLLFSFSTDVQKLLKLLPVRLSFGVDLELQLSRLVDLQAFFSLQDSKQPLLLKLSKVLYLHGQLEPQF